MKTTDLLQAALLKQAFIPLFNPGQMALGGGLGGGLLGAGLGYAGNRLLRGKGNQRKKLIQDVLLSALMGGGLGAATGGGLGALTQQEAVSEWGKKLADPAFAGSLGADAGQQMVANNGVLGLLDTLGTSRRMAADPEAANLSLRKEWPAAVKEEYGKLRINPFATPAEIIAGEDAVDQQIKQRLMQSILTPYEKP